MCTGKLEIPIENIEERPDLRCYVKIRADNLRQDICGDFIDGYLSAVILRDIRPELFTFLRAIFLEVTTNLDTIPGRNSRVTEIGIPMKVGLGRSEFRNLEIEGNILRQKRSNKRLKVDRDAKVAAKLKERWQNVRLHSQDMKMFQRILKLSKLAKEPGSKGEHYGQINKFADDLDSVLKRIPLEQEQVPTNVNQATSDETEAEVNEAPYSDNEKIKATYTDMSTKDFVPAVKIIGDRKLNCLVQWKKRVEKANWPPRNIVEEIFNTDVFLVARDAPMNPDHHRDFCYSFNLAELKLADCLSSTQRRVYLILKSYLSGRIQRLYRGIDMGEMKLKTYFLKTAFFWVCEREDPSLWGDQNIIAAVKKVLHFLQQCLQEKKLSHYFVNSNMFVELEDLECDVLQNIIQQIICEPIFSIADFEFVKEICKSVDNIDELKLIKWNDCSKGEIWLNQNEVKCLSELKEDGGRIKHLDTLEDALIDIQRGFNESQRDDNGNVPIKEAVTRVIDLFIDEERQKQISDGTSEGRNTPQAKSGTNTSQTASTAGFLSSFLSFDPVLELKNAVGKYLSCRDEEEEKLLLYIKFIGMAYFIDRKE